MENIRNLNVFNTFLYIYNIKTKVVYYILQYLTINQYLLLCYTILYFYIYNLSLGKNFSFFMSNVLICMHTFIWNFFDFVWHSDCHGYFRPSTLLKKMCELYLFFFWSGMDYQYLILGHLKHHAHMDTIHDAQKVGLSIYEIFKPQQSNLNNNIELLEHTNFTSNVAINHESSRKSFRYRRLLYIIFCMCLCIYSWRAAIFLEWTSTTWQFNVKKVAHYCRQFRADNNILKVNQRSILENILIMFLVLDDFDHYQHHKNGKLLQLNYKVYFDGHSVYYWIIKPFERVLFEKSSR